MTQQQITFYGELFEKLSLSEMKVEIDGESLFLKRELKVESNADLVNRKATDTDSELSSISHKSSVKAKQDEIKAPLLGIFHRAPSPQEAPFVEKGDTVKKGDVLCVIEAMKMMNEITAGKDGVITAICAEENTIVEYGQTIFEIA